MLDQKVITIPGQSPTSYDTKQQWSLHVPVLKLQTQEGGIWTVPPAELATDKGSPCPEPSANPELHPACFKSLDFSCHLSTEKEKAADTGQTRG